MDIIIEILLRLFGGKGGGAPRPPTPEELARLDEIRRRMAEAARKRQQQQRQQNPQFENPSPPATPQFRENQAPQQFRPSSQQQPRKYPQPQARPPQATPVRQKSQKRQQKAPPATPAVQPAQTLQPIEIAEHVFSDIEFAGKQIIARPESAAAKPPLRVSATTLHNWLTPATLNQQFILTEILQPPLALRPPRV